MHRSENLGDGKRMKRIVWISVASLAALFILAGCCSKTSRPIHMESLKLGEGARFLVCEYVPGLFASQVKKLRQEVKLTGVEVVSPADGKLIGFDRERQLRQLIRAAAVDMALVASPKIVTEKRYNPYSALVGYRDEPHPVRRADGSVYFEYLREPVYETRYLNECTRTIYSLYQYDGSGQLLGHVRIEDMVARRCPEQTEQNIHFDDFDYLIRWLKEHISAR